MVRPRIHYFIDLKQRPDGEWDAYIVILNPNVVSRYTVERAAKRDGTYHDSFDARLASIVEQDQLQLRFAV